MNSLASSWLLTFFKQKEKEEEKNRQTDIAFHLFQKTYTAKKTAEYPLQDTKEEEKKTLHNNIKRKVHIHETNKQTNERRKN